MGIRKDGPECRTLECDTSLLLVCFGIAPGFGTIALVGCGPLPALSHCTIGYASVSSVNVCADTLQSGGVNRVYTLRGPLLPSGTLLASIASARQALVNTNPGTASSCTGVFAFLVLVLVLVPSLVPLTLEHLQAAGVLGFLCFWSWSAPGPGPGSLSAGPLVLVRSCVCGALGWTRTSGPDQTRTSALASLWRFCGGPGSLPVRSPISCRPGPGRAEQDERTRMDECLQADSIIFRSCKIFQR